MTSADSLSHPVALPRGSLVLVTGATGFIASHVCLAFLEHGYRVRGTVRNRAKAAFFSAPGSPFERFCKDGSLELVDVPDMTVPGAYRDAIRDVSAVINLASIMTMETDPDKVIPGVVASVTDLLRAAAAEPSVKRFVQCSSSSALYDFPSTTEDDPEVVTSQSWNELAPKLAYDPATPPQLRGVAVYAASKVLGDKAAWKFVAEEKPGFTLNVILPFLTLGRALAKEHLGGTNAFVLGLLASDSPLPEPLKMKVCHVNVRDVAMLHLIAAVDPDVQNKRLLGIFHKVDLNNVVAQLRREFPDQKWRDSLPGVHGVHAKTFETSFERSLLKKWADRDPISLEQSVREVIESST